MIRILFFAIAALIVGTLAVVGISKYSPTHTENTKKEDSKISDSHAQEKKEVLNFSLAYLKAHFDKNCGLIYDSFNNKVYDIGGGEYVDKEDLAYYCKYQAPGAAAYIKDFDTYLKSFNQRVLTMEEANDEFGLLDQNPEFKFTDNDYYFIGFETKEGKYGTPLSRSYYRLIVTDNNGKMKISGLVFLSD